MTLEYEKLPKGLIKRLKSAHDEKREHIRKDFFKEENNFFQKHIRNKRVLIAGSGLGHDSFELSKYNKEVIGVELVKPLISLANKEKNKIRIRNVKFAYGDFTKLKYASKSFDAAILNMGTIGNFDNKEKIIKELLRVAKKVYLDFYLEDKSSLKIRKKMYEEEKWKNVRIEGTIIRSDDGLESASMTKNEMTKICHSLGAEVKYNLINSFTIMATIYPVE